MVSAQLVVLMCFLLGEMVQETHLTMPTSRNQDSGFLLAHVGEKVTMRCTYEGNQPAWICWYMQTLGQKPKLMSSVFVYGTEISLYEEFKNSSHYFIEKEGHLHYLTISDLKMSDSATYYCALSHKQVLYFGKGTTVSVKGPGFHVQASVHQLESETIQPGDSVTLNCAVQIDSCDGEHSVYWFRNSEESQPGLIYTYGSRKDQCVSNSSTKSQICVHSLSMKNLNASHAGIYHCAVASCGHVVFGNGTMLSLSCEKMHLVHFLAGSLATLLVVLLIALGCKLNKKYHQRSEPEPTTATEGTNQDTDRIHYASINVDHSHRSRRQRSSTTSECVYSKISRDK